MTKTSVTSIKFVHTLPPGTSIHQIELERSNARAHSARVIAERRKKELARRRETEADQRQIRKCSALYDTDSIVDLCQLRPRAQHQDHRNQLSPLPKPTRTTHTKPVIVLIMPQRPNLRGFHSLYYEATLIHSTLSAFQ